MNVLGLISLFVVLTIHFALFKTGQVKSMVTEDVNKNASWMNCSLNFTSEKEHRLFNITIKNNRLIKLSMKLTWTDNPENAAQNNIDITKSTWFLATEDAGKDLLLLEDQFEVMSLGTLAISVGDVALTLNQIPQDCIGELSELQAIEAISEFLLKAASPERVNDEIYEQDEPDTIYVCNGTITGSGLCCLSNNQGIITCSKLEQNEWTLQFGSFVFILSWIIFSQCIRLIPKSLYLERYVEQRDVLTPINLNIETTAQPTHRGLVNISGRDNFKNFKKYCPEGKQVSIKALNLFLDDERFESQASNTSALKNVFYDCKQMFNDIFCKCYGDFSDLEGLKECCYYDMIHKLYTYFSKIIIFVVFSSPLVIRLLFLYYFVEKDPRRTLQTYRNCIAYVLIVSSLYFVFLSIPRFKKVKSIYEKCLKRSMDKVMVENIHTRLKRVGETINMFFRTSDIILYNNRFSRLSLMKAWLTIVIIWFPVYNIILFFQLFLVASPPIYFLCWTAFEFKVLTVYLMKEFSSRSCCFIITIYTSLLLILHSVLWVLMLLFVQAAVFFANCCLYMIIGCLLNFDNLFVYFSFVVMISTYIFQCIRDVNTKIRNINKVIIKVLSKHLESLESQKTLDGSIVVKRDGIYFSTCQLSYVFKEDKHDRVKYLHVSRSFLNYLSSIPSTLTPGSRNWLYFKSFMEIVLMVLLLALVLVIVVSYGNATNLSTGMKTLITLSSGALLFLFNIFLIRSFSHSTYDDNELLETFLRSHIEDDFNEMWEIKDFGNFSADNTESYANLYCKFKNKYEIQFFTKESLKQTADADFISCGDTCEWTLKELGHMFKTNKLENNYVTNNYEMTNERILRH